MTSSAFLLFSLQFASTVLALPPSPLSERATGGVYTADVYIPSNRKDDQFYNIDISYAGQKLPTFLDTGSGDLFVAGDQCNVVNELSGCYLSDTFQIDENTKVLTNESFGTVVGTGGVRGNQSIINVGIGSGTVKNFGVPLIDYADYDEFQEGSFSGIFGLAPRNVSRNWYYFNRLPIIDTMIGSGALKSPKFSLSFPRLGDPKSVKTGQLTIGDFEKLPAGNTYTSNEIINSPNYNYDNTPFSPQSWTSVLQAIRMNGQNIPVGKGSLDPQKRYMSLFDSGAQQILFRRDELNGVLNAFSGKKVVQNDTGVYFDCSVPQLLELKYNGVWYPVDPLDMIIPSDHGNKDGTELCHAALASWDRAQADSIIGVPFLRNVVSTYDYVSTKMYSVQPRFGLAGTTDSKAAVSRYSSVYKQRLL